MPGVPEHEGAWIRTGSPRSGSAVVRRCGEIGGIGAQVRVPVLSETDFLCGSAHPGWRHARPQRRRTRRQTGGLVRQPRAMDVLEAVASRGGVMRRSALGRSRGVARGLADAAARGALRDLGGGWISTVGADPAVVAAHRFSATITCVSAARLHGLQLLREPDHVHLAVPIDRATDPRRGGLRVVLHREGLWTPPEEVGVPLAPIGEVLTRVLRCLPPREAIVVVDSALHQRLIEVEQVTRSLAGPGSPRARQTLARCDAGSRSANETLVRLELVEAGLEVETAVVIEGVGEVDLVVEGRVVVECDGYAYHSGRREFQRDRERDRRLVALGYRVLRFTSGEIDRDPQQVVAAVLRTLKAPATPMR